MKKICEATSYTTKLDKWVSLDVNELQKEPISWWFNPEDQRWNAIIIFNGKRTRIRAALLVIDTENNRILLSKESGHLALPGGGLDKGETLKQAAVREAEEEVRVTVQNAKYTHCDYVQTADEVTDWVKEHVPEEHWWYNYFTCLVLAEYTGVYSGEIEKQDKDFEMMNTAEWYNISEICKDKDFKEPWKEALKKFKYLQDTEKDTDDLVDKMLKDIFN